jgi:cell division protease FtsH
MAMTEDEKLATAYHEAGHALINVLLPQNDPLHKVTIIPRGRALGVTMSLPERDKLSYSKQWCEARIAMTFGGRVAEQLIYGEDHLNTGASNDIMQATDLARRMVTEWGMSEKLGPLRYNENQQEVFLGHAITQRQNMSEDTAKLIDIEVRRIVSEGYHKAREIIFANKPKLEAVTQALMEFETISGEECKTVMDGGVISRKADDEDRRGPAGPAVPVAGKARPRDEPGSAEPQPA